MEELVSIKTQLNEVFAAPRSESHSSRTYASVLADSVNSSSSASQPQSSSSSSRAQSPLPGVTVDTRRVRDKSKIADAAEVEDWLCQDTYVDKVAAKYHVQGTRIPRTPLPSQKLLINQEKATPQETLLYQQIIGSNNFAATMTRLDIAFSISNLSQFLQNPSDTHLVSARRVVGYLQATQTYAL